MKANIWWKLHSFSFLIDSQLILDNDHMNPFVVIGDYKWFFMVYNGFWFFTVLFHQVQSLFWFLKRSNDIQWFLAIEISLFPYDGAFFVLIFLNLFLLNEKDYLIDPMQVVKELSHLLIYIMIMYCTISSVLKYWYLAIFTRSKNNRFRIDNNEIQKVVPLISMLMKSSSLDSFEIINK